MVEVRVHTVKDRRVAIESKLVDRRRRIDVGTGRNRARAAFALPYSAATCSSVAPTSGANADASVVRCEINAGFTWIAAATAGPSSNNTVRARNP